MQRRFSQLSHAARSVLGIAVVAVIVGIGGGCGGCTSTPSTAPGGEKGPGTASLTISCRDSAVVKILSDRAAAWAARTGTAVRFEPKPLEEVANADLVIVRPAELGDLAVHHELAPIPVEFRSVGHPLQWNRLAPVYRSNLVSWGEDSVALPVIGDGMVLVYRADRLADPTHRKAYANSRPGRSLVPPTTWEDYADVAEYFTTAAKDPCLPPLPDDPRRLLTLYQHLAACYDRRARIVGEPGEGPAEGPDPATSFHLQSGTWEPRITAPSFVAAADWLARTRPFRMPPGSVDSPIRALEGPAVMAVVSFTELALLPKDASGAVDPRYRIAPLPGTKTYFDPSGAAHRAVRQVNYIPFVGFNAWVGAVLRRSPGRTAAWDLLAELAGPSASQALVSSMQSGPFRTDHVEEERRQIWLGYGFDADRTRELAVAARHSLGIGAAHPAIPLRTPDQEAVMTALEQEVRRAANGEITASEAVNRVAARWKKIEAAHSASDLRHWRRNAAGLPNE